MAAAPAVKLVRTTVQMFAALEPPNGAPEGPYAVSLCLRSVSIIDPCLLQQYEVASVEELEKRVPGCRSQLDNYVIRIKSDLNKTMAVQPPAVAWFSSTGAQPFVLFAADQTNTGQQRKCAHINTRMVV